MSYQPIEDYGIVGNLRTAALIGKNGSVDWYCFPRFDSPSVFKAYSWYRSESLHIGNRILIKVWEPR